MKLLQSAEKALAHFCRCRTGGSFVCDPIVRTDRITNIQWVGTPYSRGKKKKKKKNSYMLSAEPSQRQRLLPWRHT